MTDRELLKFAAKAAGIEAYFDLGSGNAMTLVKPRGFQIFWNPLTNDDDALRLAVKLGIDVLFTAEDVEAVATQHAKASDGEMISPWACESWTLKQQDPYAATRRAIVRAAAAIGKEMP